MVSARSLTRIGSATLWARTTARIYTALGCKASRLGRRTDPYDILPQRRRNGHAFVSRCNEKLDGTPPEVADVVRACLCQIEAIDTEVASLDLKIKKGALKNAKARRMKTMPGIGPTSAMAIRAFCLPLENFRKGRDFAVWLGLVPRQLSIGGSDRLGRIKKMGQQDVRKPLVIETISVISASERNGHCDDSWLAHMLSK